MPDQDMPQHDAHHLASDKAHCECCAQLAQQIHETRAMIKQGFPDGDLDTHRRVHESYIRAAEERSALWRSVREKVVSGIVWAALLFVGASIWTAVKSEAVKPAGKEATK